MAEKLSSLTIFKYYLFSNRAIWYWSIIALTIVIVTFAFFVSKDTLPFVYVNYFLASIFVLGIPGYVFIKVIYPIKELQKIERIALSCAMSLVIVSINGLLLSYTPPGMQQIPLVLSLTAFNTIFATIALIREHSARLSIINQTNSG